MANEEFNLDADVTEEGGEEEEQEGGLNLKRYLPYIAGVLVVQIIIGYLLVNWLFAPDEVLEEEEVVEEVLPAEEEQLATNGPLGIVSVVYENIEDIVVNPAGTEGLRFLSAKINLGLASPEVEVFIEENKQGSKIRDRLIDILRSKTITQLEPENHQRLKDEIKERLNVEGFLGVNAVVEVYFQNFVLQ